MSELKVIDLGNIRESIEKGESVYYEYYPKSEVDKLIAEKNERIVELQSKVTLAGLAEDCSNLRNETRNGRNKMKNSICDKCSSRGYCRNRENGMMACNNFNKFPKATGSYENWLRGKEREG